MELNTDKLWKLFQAWYSQEHPQKEREEWVDYTLRRSQYFDDNLEELIIILAMYEL